MVCGVLDERAGEGSFDGDVVEVDSLSTTPALEGLSVEKHVSGDSITDMIASIAITDAGT